MSVQNETKWLLDVIKSNYPVAWPSSLVRRNRDTNRRLDGANSPVYETGVDATIFNAVSASLGDKGRTLFGTKPQYKVITEVDVRVEGKHERENGQITGGDQFNQIVAYVQNAINQELVYPTVNTGDEDIGRVSYKDLGITNDNNLSPEYRDKFEYHFTVRLRGYQDTP